MLGYIETNNGKLICVLGFFFFFHYFVLTLYILFLNKITGTITQIVFDVS